MNRGFSSYKTFGIREGWMREFFENPEKWWVENSSGKGSLGPAQFESMRRWLSEAEIFDTKNGVLTETGKLLREIGVDDDFTWAVIWTNLARNSGLISWYLNLEWGRTYTRDELLDLMGDDLSLATRKNGLQSLVELFRHTPLGEGFGLGILKFKGRKCVGILKRGVELTPKLKFPLPVVAYFLCKYSELAGTNEFELSEIYGENSPINPYRIFGIPFHTLYNAVETLNKRFPEFIGLHDEIVHLNANFEKFLR